MDILNLFKDAQPKFETTLPFSKKQVLFTAFKVKDAKKIALVLQENNKKLSLISLYECIKENSNLKNIDDLCLADAEYLFLQIRSKSVDELLNVLVNGSKYQIQINNIITKNILQNKTIVIGSSIVLNLESPVLADLLKQDIFDDQTYAKACIKSINISGQVFYLDKFLTKECQEIIDNMPISTIKDLNKFVETEPRLYFAIKDETNESEVNGFLSFFI